MATKTTDTTIPKIVLGVAAHPDDLDFGMAGTVAAWAKAGADIYYYILTNGARGTADAGVEPRQLIESRQHEQREAARVLGVRDVLFADYEDGTLSCCSEVTRDIVRQIRRLKPDVVMTMDPCMTYNAEMGFINHPDHRAAGQATLDAVYPYARDHLSFPELLSDEGLNTHKVKTVYLLNLNTENCYIDISSTIDKKMSALAAHVSQMSDLRAVQDMLRSQAAHNGSKAGVEYAEAFVRIDVKPA